jgi:hypothetical protein
MAGQNKRGRDEQSPPQTPNKKIHLDNADSDLSLLTVLELKAELKQMQYKRTGSKSELMKRLSEVRILR